MNKLYVGVITSTHGIKGELKIKSSAEFKEKIFKLGNTLIINDKDYIIKSYRVHKGFDMVTLNDYKDINEVLFLLKSKVYIDKDALIFKEDEILDEDLISYSVLTTDNKRGIIKEIFASSPTNKIIRIEIDNKETLVPYNNEFIKSINKETKEITIELIEGM